jgi:Flp pilus assembly protein TadG
MGIFEFARAMMVQTLLTSASQQGARAGALNGAQASDVTTAVNSYLSGAGVTGATATCTPSPPSSAQGYRI